MYAFSYENCLRISSFVLALIFVSGAGCYALDIILELNIKIKNSMYVSR